MKLFLRLFPKGEHSACQYCQGLRDGQLRIPAAELIRGLLCCPACQLLYQSITPADLGDPRIVLVHVRLFGDSQVTHTFDPKSDAVSRQLRADEGFHKGGWFAGPSYPPAASYPPVERAVELFRHEGKTAFYLPSVRTARDVAAAADSPECLEHIRTWLADCDRKHRRCGKTTSTLLPDRVVFVGPGSDPRLVESRGTRGKYIALSHRWGGQVALQLRTHTMADFLRGIPFARFPKTFQDAIQICRALAVDYIWIDSICIIQDAKEDWEIQGSKMDQIYANCFLTIAADGAENSEAGFIHTSERADLATKTRKLVCCGPAGRQSELFVRPWREFGSLGGFGRHYEIVEGGDDLSRPQRLTDQGSYLLQRGWVLQETFLPRRVLHFLRGEVTWRCSSVSRCECQVRPHDRVVHEPLDREQPREINTDNLKEYWKEVVEQYTRRQLTFPSDRLAALAGCASRAHAVHRSRGVNVEYYAGLWSDALPSTLLWIVDRPVESPSGDGYESHRIAPSIAPTWSWASVTGHVDFLFWKRNFGRGGWAKSDPDLTALQVQCSPAGQNKYGSVSGATLTAEGYLCKVQAWLTGGSRWHFPLRMEAQAPKTIVSKASGFFYPDTEEILASLQDKRDTGIPMTVVSVYESRMFLVLRRVEEDPFVFERIGVCYCNTSDRVVLPEWGSKQRFTLV